MNISFIIPKRKYNGYDERDFVYYDFDSIECMQDGLSLHVQEMNYEKLSHVRCRVATDYPRKQCLDYAVWNYFNCIFLIIVFKFFSKAIKRV